MKIGILTQPLQDNYGGIIQAYALQTILRTFGHETIILNREKSDNIKVNCFVDLCKKIIRKVVGCPKNKSIGLYVSSYKIRKFISKYISVSPDFFSTDSIRKYSIQNSIDAFVVGSDQVWRPMYSPCITNYFLDFTEGLDVTRISYAASFGVDTWEYDSKDTIICSTLVKAFNQISVREISGIKLCKDYLNIDASFVLDPTLLLEQKDYIRLFIGEQEKECKGDMFCYVLDSSVEKERIIKYIERKKNYRSYFCNVNKQKTLFCGRQFIKPSLTHWLRCFYDAKYVVVDSFHGCVFSIIFNKTFIVIANKKRGVARFESLLSILGLQNRLIYDIKEIDNVLEKDIDWKYVHTILEKKKNESINYLKSSLNDKC